MARGKRAVARAAVLAVGCALAGHALERCEIEAFVGSLSIRALSSHGGPPLHGALVPRRALDVGSGGLRLQTPSRQLVEAVEASGGRVTKADVLARGVAAKGLERQLMELARTTGASLSVSDKGELLFDFPEDLRAALRRGSTAARLQQAWARASPWLSYTGRVLFGASLLATVAMLYSAVLIMISTSTSRDRNSSDGGGSIVSQNTFNIWFGQDVFFWLMPRPYGYSYYGYGVYGYSFPREPTPKMSFFESVFSFVFGDGDPNTRLRSESRWQLIAERIAANDGCVVAEQVAPYLDPPDDLPRDAAARRRALDRAMLPVLLRFRGEAKVSDDGEIAYVFPELQESSAVGALLLEDTSTSELRKRLEALIGRPSTARERGQMETEYSRAMEHAKSREDKPPPYLKEQQVKFSQADDSQLAMCVGYGAFGLAATLYLGMNMASGKAYILARYYPVMRLVVRGFPFLLAYTAAFLGIPALRRLRLQRSNKDIAERNAWRSAQAETLRRPSGSLRDKIRETARWALRRNPFKAVFDSSKEVSGQ